MKYKTIAPDAPDLDGLVIDVRHGDKLRAEREMMARGYGKAGEAPVTMLTIALHRAALRAELPVPADFDDFADSVDDFQRTETGNDADPFRQGATTEN